MTSNALRFIQDRVGDGDGNHWKFPTLVFRLPAQYGLFFPTFSEARPMASVDRQLEQSVTDGPGRHTDLWIAQ